MIDLKPIIPVAALLLLNACSSDSTTTTASGDAVSAITVSGNTVSLDGTYTTGCHERNGGADSAKEDLQIAGNIFTYTNTDYSGPVCATTVETGTLTATMTAGTTSAITGWVDGGGSPATAPMAADSSGPLSDTEAFTPIAVTVTSVTGTIFGPTVTEGYESKLFYIIDDTGANNIMYRDDDYENDSLKAFIGDFYTKQ